MTEPRPSRTPPAATARPTLRVPTRVTPSAQAAPSRPASAPARAATPARHEPPSRGQKAGPAPASAPARPAAKVRARPSPNQRMGPRPAAPAPAPQREGERLAKRVAALVNCSRREAEQIIEGGWVQVNGQVVEEPMVRVLDQTLLVDPQANPMALSEVTLLLHKPPGWETMAPQGTANKRTKPAQALLQPAAHWAQDESGERVLKRHFAKLSASVPLETAASGLVVFTQDWRVLRKLTEDAGVIEHEFVVEVQGEVSAEQLHRLNHAPASARDSLPPVKISVNSTSEAATRLRYAVKGAHPGLAAYLCECAGLQILSLKRLRIGRVTLAHLPEGQWRYLNAHERF